MVPLLLIAAVLVAVAWRAVLTAVRMPDRSPFRDGADGGSREVRYLREFARAASLVAVAAMLVCVAFPDVLPREAIVVMFALAVISAFVFGTAKALARYSAVLEPRPATLVHLITAVFGRWAAGTVSASVRAWRVAVPRGSWNEFRVPVPQSGIVFSARTVARLCGVSLIVGFAVVIVGLVVQFGSMDGPYAVMIRAMAGFNALFVVSIFTIAAVGATVLLLITHGKREGVSSFRLRVALLSLAGWVGGGSLAGMIAAAVSPWSKSLELSGLASGALLPSVLVDLPSVGLIGGYAAGLVGVMIRFGDGSPNLFYRYLLAPGVFTLVLVGLWKCGLTPEALFGQLVTTQVDVSGLGKQICTDEEPGHLVQAHLGDPVWLMALAAKCGTAPVIPGRLLVTYTSVATVAIALTRFARGLWVATKEHDRLTASR